VHVEALPLIESHSFCGDEIFKDATIGCCLQ